MRETAINIDYQLAQRTIQLHNNGGITVIIPAVIKRRCGRKFIITPQNQPMQYETAKINDPLVKAVLRAFHWKEIIESGKAANITEIARKEQISDSYAMRLFRMNFLAPDIIDAILKGRQPKYLTVMDFLEPLPLAWSDQRRKFGFPEAPERGQ